MGSTVSVGKKVGAFKAPNGRIGYVLFENKYSKNTYPHTPHWSCVGFGYIEDVMKSIFSGAAVCEGGSLQGRGGHILPESYIASWLKELQAPWEMPNVEKQLRIDKTFGSPIPADKRLLVLESLVAEGFVEQAEVLASDGSLDVSLDKDLPLLKVIYGTDAHEIGPWRLIREGLANTLEYMSACPEQGYIPTKSGPTGLEVPKMFRLDGDCKESVLVQSQSDNRVFHCGGWVYSVVGSFIKDYAAMEIKHPGSYKKAISDYRAAVESAPTVSRDFRVVVDLSAIPSDRRYQRDIIHRMAAAVGVVANEVEPFVTTWGALVDGSKVDSHLHFHASGVTSLAWMPTSMPEVHEQEDMFESA